MGFMDSVKAWLQNESAEAADLGRSTSGKISKELDRREAIQNASPSERMNQLQDEIAENNSSFAGLQDKIDAQAALADAKSEVEQTGEQPPGDRPSNEKQDLEIEDAVIVKDD